MEILQNYGNVFLVLAGLFAFFMAWGVGANDVANAMGTSVGAKALTIKQAILIAMIFEFTGAYLAGGEVTATIRSGIIDSGLIVDKPDLLVIGMLSAMLAAGVWLTIASLAGWPVSTTHSIVGAIIGFASVGIGFDAVQWGEVVSIIISWVASPIIAGFFSYCIFRSVQYLILDTDDPFACALKYVPFYMFFTGFSLSLMTFVKGLSHVGLHLSFLQSTGCSFLVGIAVALLGRYLLLRIKPQVIDSGTNRFFNVEKIFSILMVFTACAMAFAHGSNDVANAIGPLAAVVGVVESHGQILESSVMPQWVLLLGGLGIVFGLMTYGYKVIATIGTKITELTPSRGFAAELAAALTVVMASGTGIPISTTHSLVGAILGVGLARGVGAIDMRVVASIFTSWLITLPAGAILSIIFFYIFKLFFF